VDHVGVADLRERLRCRTDRGREEVRALRTFLLAVFATAALPSRSEQIVVHLGSYHAPRASSDGTPLNNRNPGLGIALDSGLVFGGYWNSYRKVSLYAGYVWDRPVGPVRAGLVSAMATGYTGRVGLLAGAAVAVPLHSGVWLRVLAAPRVSKYTQAVVHLSVGIER
jgi:hypothetical protein